MHTSLKNTLYVLGASALLALSAGSCSELDNKPTTPDNALEDQCTDGCNLPAYCDSALVLSIESCIDTTAIDLCKDVQISWEYLNNIPGITGFTIVERTKDTCGYVGAQGPALIGAVREYQITDVQGDAESLEMNKERFVNDFISVQTWLKDDSGRDASIVWPGNATQVQVIIGEVSDSEYGIGYLLRQGKLDFSVDLYGQHISVLESGDQLVRISDPNLMAYRFGLSRPRITAQKLPNAVADSLLSLYGGRQ